jgi:tRNA (guanine-N7-)-methyltransferase
MSEGRLAWPAEGVYTAASRPTHGHIRSFVLRQGRVSNAQQRYYEEMMPKIGIPYAAARSISMPCSAVRRRRYPRNRFRHGRDLGDHRRPSAERLLSGLEVHTPGVGSLCKLIAERGWPTSASSSTTRSKCCAT